MKRSQLAFAAVVVGLAACSEAATAPESSSFDPVLRAARISRSNPPPPPIDTGASVSISLEIATNRMSDPFGFGTSLPSQGNPDSGIGRTKKVDPLSVRTSISVGSADPLGPAAVIHTTVVAVLPFTLPVTYNRDEHAPTGYVQFHDDPPHHVTVDLHAEVIQDPHNLHFVGVGKVHIPTPFGVVDLHLGTVTDSGTVFEGCGPNLAVPLHPELCFGIHLGTASVNGHFLGTVTITPACYPKPENHFCVVPTTHH